MSNPMTANPDQVAYWNAGAGDTWASLQDRLDHQLEPLGLRAMAALAPTPGERILDVGCGAGQTSLALTAAVAPGGSVLAVDISHPLLEVARRRAEGLANLTFQEADAQTAPFEAASLDAAFSRFGVMFFADPPAAFANIRRALKPGGRLAFVCWRRPDENPFMTLPMAAAITHLPAPQAPPPAPDPHAPGPFAFADPERVRGILAAAGFGRVEITPHDQKIGSGDLDQALTVALKIGPLGAMLREHPDRRDAVVDAVREALRPHAGPEGVKLPSATWIATARA
ncbi:class I SAM-dependent methyltransferase [Phenylobacterium sp.]|uniref:class I SAM-dependent methyltransferase n=1 Tax=Phenylobacterium sp. TaxID=1871053 RepID=UPI002716694E|nr:class I SAM-dependent methyltransferase [Phenylobacterium sp.]MDO8379011.1 methyltransferase domain-containing protein [Phenylobacterium sp.]